MPGTTSTAVPSFSHDQHHKTDAAKRKGGRPEEEKSRVLIRVVTWHWLERGGHGLTVYEWILVLYDENSRPDEVIKRPCESCLVLVRWAVATTRTACDRGSLCRHSVGLAKTAKGRNIDEQHCSYRTDE